MGYSISHSSGIRYNPRSEHFSFQAMWTDTCCTAGCSAPRSVTSPLSFCDIPERGFWLQLSTFESLHIGQNNFKLGSVFIFFVIDHRNPSCSSDCRAGERRQEWGFEFFPNVIHLCPQVLPGPVLHTPLALDDGL